MAYRRAVVPVSLVGSPVPFAVSDAERLLDPSAPSRCAMFARSLALLRGASMLAIP